MTNFADLMTEALRTSDNLAHDFKYLTKIARTLSEQQAVGSAIQDAIDRFAHLREQQQQYVENQKDV